MPVFRKSAGQAHRLVATVVALGIGRHEHKHDGRIHSVGTARSYEQSLTAFENFRKEQLGLRDGLRCATAEQARAWLESRAATITQAPLDRDRLAITTVFKFGIERFESRLGRGHLSSAPRAYSTAQVKAISCRQGPANQLATQIAAAAGLRAHELYTLRPAHERPASVHRVWAEERFDGRSGTIYTVEGKGGLVREILIPETLAKALEARRLEVPSEIRDRSVNYVTRYDVGAGNAWSKSFGDASRRELGWSAGAHGLRHSYAQERMEELQSRGHSYGSALEITSQEMGHFRGYVTEVYLR